MNKNQLRSHCARSAALAALLIFWMAFASTISAASVVRNAEAANAERVTLVGHVLPVLGLASVDVAKSTAVSGDEPLTLTIVLNRSDPEGFATYLADVYDDTSPNFRKFLSPIEVASRFGPTQDAYDAVLDFATSQNLRFVQGSTNRMTLSVSGTRAEVENALSIRVENYQLDQKKFFANNAEPSLPKSIAGYVHAITGLSSLGTPARLEPLILRALRRAICSVTVVVIAALNGASASSDPVTFAAQHAAYLLKRGECLRHTTDNQANQTLPFSDPPPPAWQGADGNGQTVGLVEFDTFNMSDVIDYIALTGLPAAKINEVSAVHVNGGAGAVPGPNQDEVLLDINVILSVAPGAKIKVYDGPFTGANSSFQAIFNAMIADHVNIISNSWAYCENQTTLADVQSIESILQGASASGISVFSGSGDTGSTCLNGSANTVAVPASSPSATAVGGTSLIVNPGATYGSETWWDGSLATPPTGQGGFGVSRFFARPAYQNAQNADAMRSIPDVSAHADPVRGWVICKAAAGGCPACAL